MKTLSLAWRLMIRPKSTIDEAIATARSTLWMIPIFWIISFDLISEEPIKLFEDYRYALFMALVALGSALLQYLLLIRIQNWAAVFLGGASSFVELRWLIFLIGIVDSLFILAVWLLELPICILISPTNIDQAGLIFYLSNVINPLQFWVIAISVFSIVRLYRFSVARALMAQCLFVFLILCPVYPLFFIFLLVD